MTWRLGVVGSPIAHSLSPVLHLEGLRLAGLEGSSERLDFDATRLGQLRQLLGERFDALSVTAPLKRAVIELCDELDEVAERTQSVNSLLVRDGRVLGRSTDGEGFVGALAALAQVTPHDRHVVVLGAGGAASAIVDALVNYGVSSVVVHARNETRVEELTLRYPQVLGHSLVYRPVDLIVNTVPTSGRGVDSAVLQGVSPDTVAVDVTYDPRTSTWLALHAELGCVTMNGLPMLAFQAAAQLSWWFGAGIAGEDLLEVLT
ncbi:MAG: shikimate dehydrogenase [Acidobacteriota bacterium]|nr:shikimate dehydrogenase [Acidobacteriota bacterium]MDE3043381.1 shikimate dehydrogenase [Acidobacteriota bacterium]MDE3107581.1 shikimate dehydrogenase [Acidobacteriota bacterium]MDE3222120.1 shikimate dehydrogenase [Acidobacteriota bacterium]